MEAAAAICILLLIVVFQNVHSESSIHDAEVKIENTELKDEYEEQISLGNPTHDNASEPLTETFTTRRLIWTEEHGLRLPKEKNEHKSAFRDLAVEGIGQRLFDSFMEKVRHPELHGHQILRDPMYLKGGMKMKKATSLLNVNMEAERMVLSGLHGLKMMYLRVIRHFGLHDIQANVRLGVDIKIEGNYKIDGQALGLLPVTGHGGFSIDMKNCSLSAVTLVKHKTGDQQDNLLISELEVAIDYKNVHFNFENLMGGGPVGSAANLVINALGEAIINNQQEAIITLLKTRFKEEISRFMS